MSVYIDEEMCTGCGTCVDACPEEAIQLMVMKASVDQEKCTGCGQCVDECPSGAISLIPEASVTVPQIYPAIRDEGGHGEIITATSQPTSMKKAALSILMGRLLPGFADILISSLKQRLLYPANTSTGVQPSASMPNRSRQRRRRVRRKWSNNR
jgi:ferredoxin